MEDDPYLILGISVTDEWDVIRQAYRRELLKHHPDKHLNEPKEIQDYHAERCRKIIIAFEVLQQKKEPHESHDEPFEGVEYWKSVWEKVEQSLSKKSIKRVLKDVMTSWIETRYHKLKIKVTIEEIHRRIHKRVRIRFENCDQVVEPIIISCESVCQTDGIQKLEQIAPDGKDIYIEWQVQSHPKFYQDGYDLIYEQPITLIDYFEGRSFTLETLEKTMVEYTFEPFRDIDIPIEIKNQGLCHKGCLRIYFKLELPKSKDLLQETDLLEFQRILKIWHHNQL
jgi:DnaJ-class molecular chaperone